MVTSLLNKFVECPGNKLILVSLVLGQFQRVPEALMYFMHSHVLTVLPIFQNEFESMTSPQNMSQPNSKNAGCLDTLDQKCVLLMEAEN